MNTGSTIVLSACVAFSVSHATAADHILARTDWSRSHVQILNSWNSVVDEHAVSEELLSTKNDDEISDEALLRAYVSRLWAEDWDSPEDSIHDLL